MDENSDDRWRYVKALFHAALERPQEERGAFLQDACTDAESRAEIDRLLAAHVDAGTFIDRSPVAGLLARDRGAPLIGNVVGHYRVERLLGSGGMGVVYAARDLDLDRLVALKFVSSDVVDAQDQLRGEAQRASRLNHPNVCTIHEVGASDGMTYFVMEHVSGQTLSALIAEHPLPLENLLNYGSQIAEALAHAHAHGLIHRDLKSGNVMVTPEGRVKVLDFGLACPAPTQRVSEVTQSTRELSREEPIAGTLPYMAPELLRAQPADARSDVWALGVVLYEMAVGRLPFEGKTGFELSGAILHQATPSLPDHLPVSLQGIIRRSLAKTAGERYAYAGAAAAAIEAVRMEFVAGWSDQHSRPRSSSAVRIPGNLPVTRTNFVGRVEELAKLAREIESNRLVTLTGVGGSGKTRLALRIAEQLRSDFRDGVWWVDLAPLADDKRVEEAVASTFGILNPQRSPREALLEYLAERRLLLVLDNCEHLLAAIADLADAIHATSERVHVLATSREGLGVTGERILAVPSLSIPRGDAALDITAVADSDAVRLFASRAAAVQPGFSVTPANASIVLDICRRLDGIPLAIELAAARARLLSVEQIRSRLEDRLALLSGRGRAIPRHQTLGTALQWSYDLLTPAEQRTLRFLSVFHGLWTLSAAAAVCGQNVAGQEVLDLVWRLVEKSLVEVVQTEGVEAHYRLLEMVRQFAGDHLIAASEAPDARARHAEYYLGRFERAGADLVGPREVETVTALELEFDNLLAAFHYSSTGNEGTERVLRATSQGWLFWVSRGRIAVGRGVLAAALQRAPGANTAGPAQALALMTSSMLARFAGDSTRALHDAERSVSLYEQADPDNHSGLAFALFQRAGAAVSFTTERTVPRQDLERGVDLSKRADDYVMRGICLNMLSRLDLSDGNLDAAEARLVEALSTARMSQSPYLLILYLANLASVHADRGRWSESVVLDREALELIQASGNRHFAPGGVLIAARILAASGDLPAAWRLAGAALGMWAQIGEAPSPEDVEWIERQFTASGADSEREDCARLQAEGKALPFEAAIVEAVRALQRPQWPSAWLPAV